MFPTHPVQQHQQHRRRHCSGSPLSLCSSRTPHLKMAAILDRHPINSYRTSIPSCGKVGSLTDTVPNCQDSRQEMSRREWMLLVCLCLYHKMPLVSSPRKRKARWCGWGTSTALPSVSPRSHVAMQISTDLTTCCRLPGPSRATAF